MKTEELNFRVVYSISPPFVLLDNINGTSKVYGMMPDIFEQLANWLKINFTYMREPRDNYGGLFNGTWTGMLGMIYRNEADLIMNPIVAWDDGLLRYASYSNAVSLGSYSLLSGKESAESGLFLYFTVLSVEVWFLILASIISITLLSATSHKNLVHSEHKLSNVIYRYFWNLLLLLLRQDPGAKLAPTVNKGRSTFVIPMLTALWLIGVAFFIMSGFQSLLVAKLSVKKIRPIANTLDDLVSRDDVDAYGGLGMALEKVLRESDRPVYQEAWGKFQYNLLPIQELVSDKSFLDVERGKTCIMHATEMLLQNLLGYYKKTSTCSMHLSDNYIRSFPVTICGRKEVFATKFNEGLTRLVDSGLPSKWLYSGDELGDFCLQENENNKSRFNPVKLESILGVILLWGAGMIISAIVLLCERWQHCTFRN